MKLKDIHILYINLDRRKDRRKFIESQFKNMGITNYTRIAGIDAKTMCDGDQSCTDYWMSRKNFNVLAKIPERIMGRAGCYLSHVKALEYAISHNISPVLIVEDDCQFMVDGDTEIPIIHDSDMIYLGGLYWFKNKSDKKMLQPKLEKIKPIIPIDTTKFKLACALSYLIPDISKLQSTHDIVTNRVKKAIDMMYVNYIQKTGNTHVINPPMCVASFDFISDVTDFGKITPSNPFDNSYFLNHNNPTKYSYDYWKDR